MHLTCEELKDIQSDLKKLRIINEVPIIRKYAHEAHVPTAASARGFVNAIVGNFLRTYGLTFTRNQK